MNNFYIQDDSLYKQFQNMTVDHYSKLEDELKSLSDEEVIELSNFQPYVEANNQLTLLVQGELLKLVKQQINKSPEIIQNTINAVKKYKSDKDNKRKAMMNDLEDYITNFSDITYNEYKQLKYNESKRI